MPFKGAISCNRVTRHVNVSGTIHTITGTGNTGSVSVFTPYRQIVNDSHSLANCNNKLPTGGFLLRLRSRPELTLWVGNHPVYG